MVFPRNLSNVDQADKTSMQDSNLATSGIPIFSNETKELGKHDSRVDDEARPQSSWQGPDWLVIFNRNVPHRFDVSQLHAFEHFSLITCMEFSDDGKYIATGTYRSAEIFHLNTGKKIAVFTERKSFIETTSVDGIVIMFRSVCFSRDGRSIMTGGDDNEIKCWSVQECTVEARLTGHTSHIIALCVSPDGSSLTSGSIDGTVRLWSIKSRACLSEISAQEMSIAPLSALFSPDGRLFAAVMSTGKLFVWDTKTGALVEGFQQSESKIHSVAFSAKGDQLVSASDSGLKSWNLGVDKRAGPDTLSHYGGDAQVAWSSNDRWIVGGDIGGSIQFWDVLDGQPQLILQHFKLECTFY